MRIVAGSLGGRIFSAPHGHRTHPMGDKVRTALFNTLGDIHGLSVLDAFSGSGAISFEAVSRGAAHAVAVEADTDAHRVIVENIQKLGLEDRVSAVRAFVKSWMRRSNVMFDIVVADPPYSDPQYKTLESLPMAVNVGGILVFCLPTDARLLLSDDCEFISKKIYGNATLVFYRKIR